MSLSNASKSALAEFPPTLSAAELDAVSWRATDGLVPYDVWVKLTTEERIRVGQLRQSAAQQLLRERIL